jgi:hypothetical protein
MKTKILNPNKEVGMRNFLGTAVAAVLAMVLLPNCAGTTNAGVAVSVSFGASAVCPAGYIFEACDNEIMDWDNVMVLNDNLIGYWVLLPGGHWALRCRAMWYNSGTLEWTFGPWWYDYSVVYGAPLPGVRFHTYMLRHYPTWHKRYFVYSYNRYQPVVERHVIINRGRYYKRNEPAVYRTRTVRNAGPAVVKSTTVITRNNKVDRPVKINDAKKNEKVRRDRSAATKQKTVTVTRERAIKQPVSSSGGNRPQKITSSQGKSRQTQMTRTRTTTRVHSNNKGNTSTKTSTRSSTRTTRRGR